MRTCTRCGVEKPLSQYYKDRAKKDGIRNCCGECDRKKGEIRRKMFPDKVQNEVRNSKYLKKYGISAQDVADMRKNQEGKCAICEDELQGGIFTCVDHNHKTGKVRALLCRPCNLLLGNARESQKVLGQAIEYLNQHNQGKQ